MSGPSPVLVGPEHCAYPRSADDESGLTSVAVWLLGDCPGRCSIPSGSPT